MMKNITKKNIALKIIGLIGISLYILFLIGEGIPLLENASFEEYSVYLLFAIYILGVYFIWKNLIVSGVIFILWHAIQWALVFWVWVDGELTLVFGLPIAVFGIITLVIGMVRETKSKP